MITHKSGQQNDDDQIDQPVAKDMTYKVNPHILPDTDPWRMVILKEHEINTFDRYRKGKAVINAKNDTGIAFYRSYPIKVIQINPSSVSSESHNPPDF
jgi:hypothetical protein